MKAWNNDPALRQRAVDAIEAAYQNDLLVHGTFGKVEDGQIKIMCHGGCAVGNLVAAAAISASDKDRWQELIDPACGMPLGFGNMVERLFERGRQGVGYSLSEPLLYGYYKASRQRTDEVKDFLLSIPVGAEVTSKDFGWDDDLVIGIIGNSFYEALNKWLDGEMPQQQITEDVDIAEPAMEVELV